MVVDQVFIIGSLTGILSAHYDSTIIPEEINSVRVN